MSSSRRVDLTLVFVAGFLTLAIGIALSVVMYYTELVAFGIVALVLLLAGSFVLLLWTIAVGVAWGIRSTR